MATKTQKYADYHYQIESEVELDEAKWMIGEKIYRDMDDYINSCTRMEIRRMKRRDAELRKGAVTKTKH